MEVHPPRAALGEVAHAVPRRERLAHRVAERVAAQVADGPEPEGEVGPRVWGRAVHSCAVLSTSSAFSPALRRPLTSAGSRRGRLSSTWRPYTNLAYIRRAVPLVALARGGLLPRLRRQHPEPERGGVDIDGDAGGAGRVTALRRRAARLRGARRLHPVERPARPPRRPADVGRRARDAAGADAPPTASTSDGSTASPGPAQQHGLGVPARRAGVPGPARGRRAAARCGRRRAQPRRRRRSGWTGRPRAQCEAIARAAGGDERVLDISGSRATERFTGPQVRRFAELSSPTATRRRATIAARELVHGVAAVRGARADRPRRRRRDEPARPRVRGLERGRCSMRRPTRLGERLGQPVASSAVVGELASRLGRVRPAARDAGRRLVGRQPVQPDRDGRARARHGRAEPRHERHAVRRDRRGLATTRAGSATCSGTPPAGSWGSACSRTARSRATPSAERVGTRLGRVRRRDPRASPSPATTAT